MSENPPKTPTGAAEVVTFITGVALPVLSAGMLINEVLRVSVGAWIPMDAVLSANTTRVLGTALVALGLVVCLTVGFDRAASRGDRRFYRTFFLVNFALGIAWTVFWIW